MKAPMWRVRDLGAFPEYTGGYTGKDFPRVEGVQGFIQTPVPTPLPIF